MNVTAEYILTREEFYRATKLCMRIFMAQSEVSSRLVRLLAQLLLLVRNRSEFRQHPKANKKIVWRFDEQKVEDSTEGASSVRAWKDLLEISEPTWPSALPA